MKKSYILRLFKQDYRIIIQILKNYIKNFFYYIKISFKSEKFYIQIKKYIYKKNLK